MIYELPWASNFRDILCKSIDDTQLYTAEVPIKILNYHCCGHKEGYLRCRGGRDTARYQLKHQQLSHKHNGEVNNSLPDI